MSDIGGVVDKNIMQMFTNHSLLDEQNKKIYKLSKNIDNIEEDNTLSTQIIHRFNSLYYRITNPLKKKKDKVIEMNPINTDRNTQIYKINDSFSNIDEKIYKLKEFANKMGDKLDDQNEMLTTTNDKLEKCLQEINKNTKLIEKKLI